MAEQEFDEATIRGIITKRQLGMLFKKNTKALSILIKALLRAEKSYPKNTLKNVNDKPVEQKGSEKNYNKVLEVHSNEGLKRGIEVIKEKSAPALSTQPPSNPLIRANKNANVNNLPPQTPLNIEG